MLPLILGAMLGGDLYKRYQQKQEDEALAAQYSQLLGQAPQEMGPPEATGAMGYKAGTGLRGNPNDPNEQLQFAIGLAAMPGQQREGLSMLQGAWQRAQQASQFDRGQAQQADQFNRSEDRQASQFKSAQDLQREESSAAANRWLQQFTAGREDAATSQGFERERLGMSREQLGLARNADARAQAAADAKPAPGAPELPKLPVGMMYVDSSSGTVAAPIPGTPDYAKVIDTQKQLGKAQANIARIVDIVAGVEQTTPAGKKIRTGGAGSELYGEKAAELSTLRAEVIADIAKLRDLGVIQQGEMEGIDKSLPDPTSWASAVGLNRNASTVKAYETLREQFKNKQTAHRSSNPWLIPPPPPGYKAQP